MGVSSCITILFIVNVPIHLKAGVCVQWKNCNTDTAFYLWLKMTSLGFVQRLRVVRRNGSGRKEWREKGEGLRNMSVNHHTDKTSA